MSCLISFERCKSSGEEHGTSEQVYEIINTNEAIYYVKFIGVQEYSYHINFMRATRVGKIEIELLQGNVII